MTKRATFPFTIGLYLCATLWLQRTGVVRLESFVVDLLGSWLLCSAVSAAGWFIAARFTPDPARRAMVALLAGLWSVLYGSYFVFAAIAFGAEWRVLAIWTALFALVAVAIVNSTASLERVSGVLDKAGFVLLLFVVLPIVRAVPRTPKPVPWIDARATNARPDVYVIVPDKYSGAEFLAREYGIDHTAMEDSLRALGFHIPRNARANFAHTRLALTTFLEGAYVITPEDTASTVQYDELPARAQASPLWEEFAAKGYRVVFFPTTFGPTSDAVGVHLKLTADRPADAEFAGTWIFHSPTSSVEATVCRLLACALTPPVPFALEPIAATEWKFRTLATLPDSGGPIFAFMHLMMPHEPFIYSDECGVGDGWTYVPEQESRNMERLRRGYAAQIKCLDRLLLATVTAIIAKSPTSIIVIQSDHGRGRVTNDVLRAAASGVADTLTAQLVERFTPFAAYRFPGADTLMHDGITPVNVIPTLRHVLWGAPLMRHRDRSFSSPYTRELDLTELSPARLRALVPPDSPRSR